jgi:hypothetical protein
MKYSQKAGVVVAVALVLSCMLPWAFIPSTNAVLDGFHGRVNEQFSFGKPALVHIVLSGVMTIFFLLPYIWAKRANVFVGAVQVGWAIRNLVLFAICRMGECPESRYGLYITVALSFLALLMALFPPGKVKA